MDFVSTKADLKVAANVQCKFPLTKPHMGAGSVPVDIKTVLFGVISCRYPKHTMKAARWKEK